MEMNLTTDVKISGVISSGISTDNDDNDDAELFEELIAQGWEVGVVTIPIGEDCGFSRSVRDLEEALKNPGDMIDGPFAPLLRFLPWRGRITSLVLTEVTLDTSSGNFASIDRINFSAADATQGTINSYSATGPFEQDPVLTPDRNIDLYSVVSNGKVDCINAEIILRGERPKNDLIFSTRAKALYEVKIGLF